MSAFLLRRAPLILLLLAATPVASAWAQSDTQMLLERINRLENDLRSVQRQVYRGSPPPAAGGGGAQSLTESDGGGGSIANRLNARIDDLENQIRQLTGRFEEVEYNSSQTQRRMDKLVEDVDFRLTQLERAGQPQPPAGGPTGSVEQVKPAPINPQPSQPTTAQNQQQPARGSTSSTPGRAPSREGVLGTLPTDAQGRPLPVTPNQQSGQQPGGQAQNQQNQQVARATPPASGKGKLPQGTPQERYNYAYKLLVQSDYADAEAAFREFVATHPQDALAGNAQYWLGETYYVRQQYEPAAQAFLQGYQTYSKNAKAPDSLLKLGMSLAALKKNPEACAALGQLAKEFPNAPPHVKDAATRERGKIGCK